MIVRYSDSFAIQLAEAFFPYADAILNVSRQLTLLTEKEFKVRYGNARFIDIPTETKDKMHVSFRVAGKSVILETLTKIDVDHL